MKVDEMARVNSIVIPRCSSDLYSLIEEREKIYKIIRSAISELNSIAPRPLDYYNDAPPTWPAAKDQHNRRLKTLKLLATEILVEIDSLYDIAED